MNSSRMALDELISRIVEEKGLSRKQVFDLIEKKKSLLSHMISDEGAADIVAKELGVKIDLESRDEELALTIADLVAGMSNVTITGRITKVNPTREFIDKTGKTGTISSLVIADKSGEMRTILWGDLTRIVDDGKIKQGQLIRVRDGYVKEDLGGRAELHVGRKGRLEIDPQDLVNANYPDISNKPKRIADLRAEMVEADLVGTVRAVNPIRVVRTKDGKDVKVSSLIVGDETGAAIRVVFWNEKAASMENAKKGDYIEIASGRIRLSKDGEIEVHIGSRASVKFGPSIPMLVSSDTRGITRIRQLKLGMRDFATEGVVIGDTRFREFTRDGGVTGKVFSFTLSDDASTIRTVAWGETAEKLRHIKSGDVIRINDANLKVGMKGELEMHIRSPETVSLLEEKEAVQTKNLKHDNGPLPLVARNNGSLRKEVCELLEGDIAEIRGMITRVLSRSPVYRACPKCLRKVTNKEGEWFCSRDGRVADPLTRVLYSLILDDGTGTITCVLPGTPGEELLGMKAGELLSNTDNEVGNYDNFFSCILGLEIVFVGKCSFNRNQNRSEFKVTSVVRPDPRAEAKILLEHMRDDFGV